MSRLNPRPEEPVPVAVSRAKRFFHKKFVPAVSKQLVSASPSGIFYEQEVAPAYRLPRSLWEPSAASQQASDKQNYATGKSMPLNIDNCIRGAEKQIQTALNELSRAVYITNQLKEEDTQLYKGYQATLDANKDISYEIWGKRLLGKGGLLETMRATNDVLAQLNVFMAEHSGNEWNVDIAKFIEIEEDGGEEVTEKLKHLKIQQSNAMLLRSANNELTSQIQQSMDMDKEAEEEQRLRMAEVEALVKKQAKDLSALLNRNRAASEAKLKDQLANREEIATNAMKSGKIVKRSVNEAKREVALEVSNYANTIVKPDDSDDDESG